MQDAQDLVKGLGRAQDLVHAADEKSRPAHGFVPSGWYTVKPCQVGNYAGPGSGSGQQPHILVIWNLGSPWSSWEFQTIKQIAYKYLEILGDISFSDLVQSAYYVTLTPTVTSIHTVSLNMVKTWLNCKQVHRAIIFPTPALFIALGINAAAKKYFIILKLNAIRRKKCDQVVSPG